MADVEHDTTVNGTPEPSATPAEPAAPATSQEQAAAAKPAEPEKKKSFTEQIEEQWDKLHPKDGAAAEPAAAAAKLVEPASKPAAAAAAEPAKEIDPVTGRELLPIKPPGGLTPGLREKWGTIPRQFQQFWVDRERDHAKMLQDSADDRKISKEFHDIVGPYEATLRQYNISAPAYTKELFRVAHILYQGTPQQKAHALAEMTYRFKPDPQTLTGIMQGKVKLQGAAATNPQQNIEALVDQRIKQRDEQHQMTQGQTELEKFAGDDTNEFFGDVKDLMKRGLDAGLIPGNTLPEILKNAYEWACQNHPEVKQIIAGRTPKPAAAAAAKPAAVQSMKPSLGAGKRPVPPKKKMSIAEAAEFAWKAHGGE